MSGILLLGSLVLAAGVDTLLTAATVILPSIEVTHGLSIAIATLISEIVVIIDTFIAMRSYQDLRLNVLGKQQLFLLASMCCTLSTFLISAWAVYSARNAAAISLMRVFPSMKWSSVAPSASPSTVVPVVVLPHDL